MILLISAWYNEPNYSFDISHKVTNLIRDKIRETIFPKYELNKKNEEWYLNLVIATDSQTKELEVRGPDVRKRQKIIDYGLRLPHTINQTANPLEAYLEYLFKSLIIVFKDYSVLENDMRQIENECNAEILGW